MISSVDLVKENYSSGDLAKLLGLTSQTIWNYQRDGILRGWYTSGGHLRFSREEVVAFLKERGLYVPDSPRIDIIYARVSSQDQKNQGDLDRQISDLVRCLPNLKNVQIISDIASGLNDNRPGLLKMMKLVSEGKVDRVLVYSKDRLTRFGFNYLDFFFSAHGTTIMLFEDVENKTGMQELVDDMMNLLASFSGKFYGLRSAKKRAARAVLDEVSSDE